MHPFVRRAKLWSFAAASGLALVVSGCGGGGGTPPVAGTSAQQPRTNVLANVPALTQPVPVPSTGAYLGAWVNPGNTPGPSPALQEQQTEAMESQLGRPLALHMHYYAWSGAITTAALAADASIQGDLKYGRIPVISWVCGDNLTTITNALGSSSSSSDKTAVENAAAALASLKTPGTNTPAPVMLRFFWEFNLDLTGTTVPVPNGDAANCFTQTEPNGQPATNTQRAAEFVAAWEAIHTAFTNAGATNVAWLWNPAGSPSDVQDLATMPLFLPPSPYTNWIGVDSYDKKNVGFDATIAPFYTAFSGKGLPILIGETGEEVGSASPCTQAQYFPDATASLSGSGSPSTCTLDNESGSTLPTYPVIKGFMYFDAGPNPSYDWILSSGTQAFTNFKSMANKPYFAPTYAKP